MDGVPGHHIPGLDAYTTEGQGVRLLDIQSEYLLLSKPPYSYNVHIGYCVERHHRTGTYRSYVQVLVNVISRVSSMCHM